VEAASASCFGYSFFAFHKPSFVSQINEGIHLSIEHYVVIAETSELAKGVSLDKNMVDKVPFIY